MSTTGGHIIYADLRSLLIPGALPRLDRDRREVEEHLRECFLCLAPYKAESKYSRFCEKCKKENEEYRFSETYSLMAG